MQQRACPLAHHARGGHDLGAHLQVSRPDVVGRRRARSWHGPPSCASCVRLHHAPIRTQAEESKMVTAHRTAQACNCSQLHPLCAHSFSVTLTSSFSATTLAYAIAY